MIDKIRPATEEEVKELFEAKNADLIPGTVVLKMGTNTAVLRPALELDPLLMTPGASDRDKFLFIWGIESFLRCSGRTEYYFNIHADEDEWQKVVEMWGAKKQSTAPEFRYKKDL